MEEKENPQNKVGELGLRVKSLRSVAVLELAYQGINTEVESTYLKSFK